MPLRQRHCIGVQRASAWTTPPTLQLEALSQYLGSPSKPKKKERKRKKIDIQMNFLPIPHVVIQMKGDMDEPPPFKSKRSLGKTCLGRHKNIDTKRDSSYKALLKKKKNHCLGRLLFKIDAFLGCTTTLKCL